jgi:hypothetical protein
MLFCLRATFWNVVVGRLKWLTWKDHVYDCILCHLHNADGQIGQSLVIVFGGMWCMLCRQYLGITTMLICDQCSRRWHIGCFTPSFEEVLKNGFAFDTKIN